MTTRNILEILEASCERHPDKNAYISQEESLTYGGLRQAAESVGTFLLRQGIEQKPVMVFMKKSPSCIAAFLGCIYARCFYVPVDTQMPEERLRLIAKNLCPAAVIADADSRQTAERLGLPLHNYEEAVTTAADRAALTEIRKKSLDTDIVYVLYTSGSTGVPKGVAVAHRSLIDYVEQFCREVGIAAEDIIANQAPFYFDASLIDIYCTMKAGGTMCIVPLALFSQPLKLLEFLDEYRVSLIRWVPSALNIVAAFKAFKNLHPDSLKKIIFGAEAMPTKCFNYWRANYPDAVFVQIYGPTEITGVCTYYIVDREFADDETIPIGTPFYNTEVFLLDEKDVLIPPQKTGVIGEICVKGTCLALGYYNDMERTAEVFTQNPLNPYYPERIYRTGDLAGYNERGELVFLSRKDFQIKHMGHRIELLEIEAAIHSVKGIKAACCLFDKKRDKIVTCYVPAADLGDADLLEALKGKLPRYMLPNVLHRLEALPMTASGKTDRVSLGNTWLAQ